MLVIKKLLKSIPLFGILLILGCAVGTSTLKVGYQGDLEDNSGLKNLSPITFVVNRFEDDRPRIDRVANKKNTYGMTMGKAVTAQDVCDIVQEAIVKELEKYNHKTFTSKGTGEARAIIDGTLREFWVEPMSKFLTVETVATVRANVVLKDARTSEVLMSRSISGIHSSNKAASWTGTWEDHLNQALKKFVSNLTTDSEFLEACKKFAN